MSDQVRVILWAPPRSLSTAFLKCMTGVPDSKLFYEPFISAYQFGPDRITGKDLSSYYPEDDLLGMDIDAGSSESVFEDSLCTYEFVQKMLEADHRGKQLIFSKDMFHSLAGRYEFIPKGYRHIFLIRDPVKVFPSWHGMVRDITSVRKGTDFDKMPTDVVPPGLSFKEGFKLFNHIKDSKLDPDPIIINADDLIGNPRVILSACCKRVGIPYTDGLLSWEEDNKIADDWVASRILKQIIKRNVTCFKSLKESCGFGVHYRETEGQYSAVILPADLQRCVKAVMPYYKAMYEHRLT